MERRPRVEDERSGGLGRLDSLDRRALVAPLGVLATRDHDRDRCSIRNLQLLREVTGELRQQVAREPREERLRLGIAETAVELDHTQPVLRPHQACVEEALER